MYGYHPLLYMYIYVMKSNIYIYKISPHTIDFIVLTSIIYIYIYICHEIYDEESVRVQSNPLVFEDIF